LATLTEDDDVPIISIATIAGTYALQALLFAMKGRWEFIGWMLVSILAIPVFSFAIPIYSYWHFDDFSWGNTRVVVGDGGKKVAVTIDEGKFDPKSIPTMKWSEYERAVLSEENWSDNMSQGSSSGYTYNSRSNRMPTPSHAPSMYGMGTMGGDNMSVYSGMAQNTRPITPQNVSMMFDRNSVAMPSSASLPMMNYANSTQMMPMQSNRSMASFAPQKTQSFISQSGQFIPMQQQQSNQFVNSSSHSLMMDGFNTGDGPRNEEILTEVQRILSTADLTKVTKKQVREELQTVFGVSMASRKDYINACIENVLQNRA
jgi:chitin synthase